MGIIDVLYYFNNEKRAKDTYRQHISREMSRRPYDGETSSNTIGFFGTSSEALQRAVQTGYLQKPFPECKLIENANQIAMFTFPPEIGYFPPEVGYGDESLRQHLLTDAMLTAQLQFLMSKLGGQQKINDHNFYKIASALLAATEEDINTISSDIRIRPHRLRNLIRAASNREGVIVGVNQRILSEVSISFPKNHPELRIIEAHQSGIPLKHVIGIYTSTDLERRELMHLTNPLRAW